MSTEDEAQEMCEKLRDYYGLPISMRSREVDGYDFVVISVGDREFPLLLRARSIKELGRQIKRRHELLYGF